MTLSTLPRRAAAALLALALLAPLAARAQTPRIQALLAQVREDRIKQDVADLVRLGTRYTLHRDFEKATYLVRDRLRQAGLTPSLDPFEVDNKQVHNVVAVLPGAVAGRPAILLSAHYDSISPEAMEGTPGARAPGAEDNASGTAALLELARVLAGQKLATEVRLVAFAAEELGLLGSQQMATRLQEQDLLASVQAVINMDMVGYDPRGERHLLVDGFKTGRALSARVGAAALRYTSLQVSAGIFSQGRSDHAPFMSVGIPSLTLASMQWHDYPHYHTPLDLAPEVDPGMVAASARTALATVLLLAGLADGPPVARAGDFVEGPPGALVRLSGAGSFDPRGQALSYSWRQVGGPQLSLQTSASGAEVSFTPGEAGSYRLELTVSTPDGRSSDPDPVAALVQGEGGCSLSASGLPGPPAAGLALSVVLAGLAWRRRGRRPG